MSPSQSKRVPLLITRKNMELTKENPTKKRVGRRIVMVPAPFQGHVPPLMNLATILQWKGFSITIAQTHFNSFHLSHRFPDLEFITIPDGLSESEPSNIGLVSFILKLNDVCEPLLKQDLVRMMKQRADHGGGDDDDHDHGDVTCVVYDEFMYFCGAVSQDLKLPSIIFSASCSTTLISRRVLMKVNADGLLPAQESKSMEELVGELHPLRFKDLPTTAYGSLESLMKLYENVSDIRKSSAMILNTTNCIEGSSLSRLHEHLQIPIFPVGPLHMHKTASKASSPSLFEEESSSIEWLDKQKPNSVIYISLGSLALMQTEEVEEMGWGLVNSRLSFLWVIRPGSIPGSEWIESLSEKLVSAVGERGCIVKWAPQKKVLAHRAVGGFWSHGGWNSTLESVSEGVPMICRPFSGDQKVNARVSSCVWGLGLLMEGELKRGAVERAVRRLMVDQEGEEMRQKALEFKGIVKSSVSSGGSSCFSLDELVNFIGDGKNLYR